MRASQLKCLFAAVFFVQSLAGTAILRAPLAPGFGNCTGYTASNVRKSDHGLSADLKLIGAGCAVYGKDIAVLKLVVNYDTSTCSISPALHC